MKSFLELVKTLIAKSDWADRSIGWFILSPEDFAGMEEIEPPPLIAVVSHGHRKIISFNNGVPIEMNSESTIELMSMIKHMTDNPNNLKDEAESE